MKPASHTRTKAAMRCAALICATLAAYSCNKSTKKQPAKTAPFEKERVESVDVTASLRFGFGPERGCLVGDMDTVSKELYNKKDQRLIMTLEPILPEDNKSFKPLVRKVDPMQAILQGTQVDFDLPRISKPIHLGLFVCKDNESKGQCNQKKPYNLAKMSNILFFKGPQRAEKVVNADKPYYFQYVLYDGKQLRFMSDEINTEARFVRFAREITSELGGNKRYHKKAFDRVLFLQKMLSSKTLEVNKNGNKTVVAAKLPLQDKKMCRTTSTLNPASSGEFKPKVSPPDPGRAASATRMAIPRIPSEAQVDRGL